MRELRKYAAENPTESSQHTMQVNNSRKKPLMRRLLLFSLVAATMVIGLHVTLAEQRESIQKRQQEIQQLSKELEELTAEKAVLEDEINKLNDDEYIAKIARRDYFFSKKGETIFPVAK